MSANPYYTHASGLPATQTRAVSSQARAEFDSVAGGFDGVYAEILALAAAIGVPTTVSEVPVASSATTDIGNGYGPVIQITGTNPITSFGAHYKGAIFIRFASSLVLTHSASLVLPGAANITTTAGDACIAIPIGNPASGWRIAAYCRMSLTLVDDVAVRTSSTYADPAWLTSVAWSKITGLPTTLAGYGITDAPTKTGTGASGSWPIDITGSAAQLGGVSAGQYLQLQTPQAFTTAGTAPTYTVTTSPVVAITAKQRFSITWHASNSGAATTLNKDGGGSVSVKQYDSAGAKVDPTIVAGMVSDVVNDGTHWVIMAPLPPAASTGRKIAQVVSTQVGTYATGTTQIPVDNTIPQNTEGDQYMSLSITPQNASSTLEIDVVIHLTCNALTCLTAALFQDSIADALSVSTAESNTNTQPKTITFKHVMAAGSTSATTFKVRAGNNSASTVAFNGATGAAPYFNGRFISSVTIKEYLP